MVALAYFLTNIGEGFLSHTTSPVFLVCVDDDTILTKVRSNLYEF
jgi:hypothetical protein